MHLEEEKRGIGYLISDWLENIVLWSRYLLVPLYLALMFEIGNFSLDFFKVLRRVGDETELTKHIMEVLELLDYTMIANLIWFIGAGSYYVFIHPYPDESTKKKPRTLSHISTGILKEKMAGSIVGVSSIYLLQWFLNVMQQPGLSLIQKIACAIALHISFIAGLLAFNYANKAEHHPHNQDSGKDGHGQTSH